MMFMFYTIHVLICLFLILVVLLQQGKGAALSVFGGGGTMTAFGARGAATLLHNLTVFAFVGFILTTLTIGVLQKTGGGSSVMTDVPATEAPAAAATEDADEAEDDAGDILGALPEDEPAAGAAEAATEAGAEPATEEPAVEEAQEDEDGEAGGP